MSEQLRAARTFVERNARRMDPDLEPVMEDHEEVILYASAGEFRALRAVLNAPPDTGPCAVCGSRHPRWTHWHPTALAAAPSTPEPDADGFMMMHNAGRHDISCKWSRPGIIDASVDPCTCGLAEDIAAILASKDQ